MVKEPMGNSVTVFRKDPSPMPAGLKIGDIIRFQDGTSSAIACRFYKDWSVARIFEGTDGRSYVRMTAAADWTVSKLVLRESLLGERPVIEPHETHPGSPQLCNDLPLPLISRRALAARRRILSEAAE